MEFGIFIAIVVVLFVIGVPVSVSLALGSMLFLIMNGVEPVAIIQRMFSSLNSTTYLCIPFFILAGEFMSKGGIGDRLIYTSKLFMGGFKGGLAYVTILAGIFFAAITGTTLACIAAIGPLMIPAMVKDGYDRSFATAVTAAGSTLGPLIPPSLALVIYAGLSGTSVKDLYLAGIPAGIIVAIGFFILIFFTARKHNYASSPMPKWKTLDAVGKRQRKKMLIDSIWALGAPVIILGGIFGGIFTPTEASVVAALYSLLVSMFVFKQIKVKDVYRIIVDAGRGTARIMFIIACAGLFSWVLSYEMVPQTILGALLELTTSKYILLIIIVVVVLIMGMFIDPSSITVITVPLFLPLMMQYGLDLVHVGVFMTALLCLGNLSPPFGTLLFTGAHIGGVSVQSLTRKIMPFIGIMLVMILIMVFVPQTISWIYS